jgi:hypothetical protein
VCEKLCGITWNYVGLRGKSMGEIKDNLNRGGKKLCGIMWKLHGIMWNYMEVCGKD